jgi:hypothetical protein
MFYYVTYWDLLLTPIYIFIFYKIAKFIANKYYKDDSFLQKKLIQGFWAKVIAGILYVMLIQFYYGGGDSFMYFGYGRVMHRAILSDSNNIEFLFGDVNLFRNYLDTVTHDEFENLPGYMVNFGNQIVVRFCCVLGFLCFQNYTVTSILFTLISFIGSWKMFLVFYKIFKPYKNQIAFAFLFLPSYLIWGSGILKESICLYALGIAINAVFNTVYLKNYKTLKMIGFFIGSFLLIQIKSYIFYSFILALVIMLFLLAIKKINYVMKWVVSILIISILSFSANIILDSVLADAAKSTSAEELLEQTKTMKNNYEAVGGSFVDLGDFEPTISGVVKKIPAALANVFFRPYPWESKNIVLLFSMFESFFFLLLFIRILLKSKIVFFLVGIFKNPIYIFFFFYVFTFGIIVGLTTFNFGAIIRYKLPAMPFFVSLLFLLNKNYSKKQITKVISSHIP